MELIPVPNVNVYRVKGSDEERPYFLAVGLDPPFSYCSCPASRYFPYTVCKHRVEAVRELEQEG